MVTHRPLHRSQRAQLTHWAPPLGHNAQALFGIGLHDMSRGNEAPHPPFESSTEPALGAVTLGATLQTAPPQPDDGVAERVERRTVAWHPICWLTTGLSPGGKRVKADSKPQRILA